MDGFSSNLYNLIIETNDDEIFIFIADFSLIMLFKYTE
jgi:hypothetical protein